jgi:hypothetical protein
MADRKRAKRTPAEIEKEGKERFIRVATRRVTTALKQIKLLANCAGSGYVYLPEQVKKMLDAIQTALATTEAAFAGKSKMEDKFKF